MSEETLTGKRRLRYDRGGMFSGGPKLVLQVECKAMFTEWSCGQIDTEHRKYWRDACLTDISISDFPCPVSESSS